MEAGANTKEEGKENKKAVGVRGGATSWDLINRILRNIRGEEGPTELRGHGTGNGFLKLNSGAVVGRRYDGAPKIIAPIGEGAARNVFSHVGEYGARGNEEEHDDSIIRGGLANCQINQPK